MPTSLRPGPDEYAPAFAGYVGRIGDDEDVVAALAEQLDHVLARLGHIPEARGDYRYAPGKWSIKEVVGHISDVERVMTYRALRIARADPTPLPGFDENAWVPAANFDARSLASLVHELEEVRRATVAFFETVDAEAAARRGSANNNPISARAIAYIIAGHERHHVQLLRERYLA